MKMTPTTLDRKARKKWLTCPAPAIVLALLLVLSSLPVYAGEQQTEQTETPTVTQDAGSESAQSATSSEQNEPLADELEPVQPIDPQEPEVAATEDWTETKPHEGQVLHGGYVGFRNLASGKYLTAPNGVTDIKTNIIQYDEVETPNAQEFLLEYTYSPSNEAYFRIFSVTANGTKSNPVKSVGSTAATANVRIDSINYLFITDRWQIEHVYGNYYYIYLDHNPGNTGTKYALTANGTDNGTSNGTSTTSQGNVYVSPLAPLNGFQMWEICADGQPMDLNSNDITDGGSYDFDETDELEFYYIPKSFNQSLTWESTNTEVVNVPPESNAWEFLGWGMSTIKMHVTNGSTQSIESAEIVVKLPNGVYYLRSVSTQMLLDLDKDSVKSGTPIQVYNGVAGEPTNFSQLYKFYYLGSGLYSIRPMRKNNMGITWSTTNNSATIQNIGTNNLYVLNTAQWYLNKNSNGYYLYAYTGEAKTITVPTNAASSTNLVVQSYTGSTNQAWTISAATQNYNEIMLTDSFEDLNAQCDYTFDVWYVTSDMNINGDAIVSWEIEQDENIIRKGNTGNSFETLVPGEAQLIFTVMHSGKQIYNVENCEQNIKVKWPVPFEGVGFIKNAFSSRVVSTGGSNQAGTTLSQVVFTDASSNEWEFVHIDDNYFYIVSKLNGLCIRANPNIAYAVTQSSIPNDPSDLDDYSIWKILRTSNDQFKIVCKAFENSEYVLSVVSETYGALILSVYSNDTDYKDEWQFNISGGELTILAVSDNNITRSASAKNAANTAEENGVDTNLIIAKHTSTQAVLYGIKTSNVFVTRSHGSPNSIVIYSLEEGRESSSLNTSDIYNYSTETVQFDLSGCELVVFIGCSTAAEANHRSIADAVVEAGAEAAIGFEATLNAARADTWMEAFLEAYYNQAFETYLNSEESIAYALTVESAGGLDSCRLIP